MIFCFSSVSKWFAQWSTRKEPASAPETTECVSAESRDDEDLLFPSWPPLNPREILCHRELYRDRMGHRKYRAPKGVFTDSSLYALYRIYEWILAGHTVNMRNELELFWWTRWPVSSIPDPGEQGDPERYAVLACIPALLTESFNERNRLGMRREEPHSILSIEEQLQWAATPAVLETEPSWTETVAPLERLLHIPHGEPDNPELTTLDDPHATLAFKRKNILLKKPHVHFV